MALINPWRSMTVLDRVLVALLLIGAVSLFFLIGKGPKGEHVVVEQQGRIVFTAPLSEDRTVSLAGPLGETVLTIRAGRARIISSPCTNKICMGMGEATHGGDLLACVPNDLLVRIDGATLRDPGYDLLSR
jgi:hypothetical protein